MSKISISTPGVLVEQVRKYSVKKAQERALVLLMKYKDITNSWKEDIRKKLLVHASLRGTIGNQINPHNEYSHNNGFPMSMTGAIAKSIWARVTIRNTQSGATISISRGFHPVYNKTDGTDSDYGNILNAGGKNRKNMVLKNYKERAYAMLDARIR